MQTGIFAKTFVRQKLADTFAAVKNYGLECLQFNFSCAGLPTLPDSIEPALVEHIQAEACRSSLFIAAVSGTCNLIHPDLDKRAKGIANLETLIRCCRELRTSVVTICTGTRDARDMWQGHEENRSPDAWRDLVKALDRLLPVAQERNVVLGVEPEPSNVIDTAPKARRLLDELRSPWLRVIFDAANLLQPETLKMQKQVLSEAAELLGPDIVVAHAKDVTRSPHSHHVAAGQGELDYGLYLTLLENAGFNGPVILHSLTEAEVGPAAAFLKTQIKRLPGRSARITNASFLPRQS